MPASIDDQPTDPLPVRGRRWRTAPHVQERLRTVADLRRRGLRQAEIAAEVGVSPATISRDVARLDRIERHQQAEFIHTQQIECLLSLREITRLGWSLIFRYKDDPDRVGDVAAAAEVIVAAQREAGRILAKAGACDPNAEDFGDDNDENGDIITGEVLLGGHSGASKPEYGEGDIADLRRDVDAEFSRYVSPSGLAVIQRGLALVQRDAPDALANIAPPDD
ncbi:MAG: helix-turn-helix domain-containing protein [Chloroflexi bacterium]|nr:helix-turn-helix domain-containing protein [Chloroflexota bacterium]